MPATGSISSPLDVGLEQFAALVACLAVLPQKVTENARESSSRETNHDREREQDDGKNQRTGHVVTVAA